MMFFVLAGGIAAVKAVLRFYRQAKKVMAKKEPGQIVAEAMDDAARARGGCLVKTLKLDRTEGEVGDLCEFELINLTRWPSWPSCWCTCSPGRACSSACHLAARSAC